MSQESLGQVTERLVEARTVLAFEASLADLAERLPLGWSPAPWTAGPSQGANVLLVLVDRLLGLDGAGSPLPGQAVLKQAVLAARAVHAQQGVALMILGGLASEDAAVPGPYGVFERAHARVSRRVEAIPSGRQFASESWVFVGRHGARIEVDLAFDRGRPARNPPPPAELPALQVRSARSPELWRTYRSDQGEDVVWSGPLSLDRLHHRSVVCEGEPFGPVLDAARLVSVMSVPWLVRTVTVVDQTGAAPMGDLDALKAIVARLERAWNANDADAWVEDYAEDCLLVNMLGAVLDGVEQNRARHAAVFGGIFRGSTIGMTVDRARLLGGERVAVVDTTLTLTGFSGLPAGIVETAPGVLIMVMRHVLERRPERWRIVLSQNQAKPPPAPSGAAQFA